jgi:hypothetical protein
MIVRPDDRGSRIAHSLAGLFLAMHPRDFRIRFGAQLSACVEDVRRDASMAGAAAAFRAGLALVLDMAGSLAREWRSEAAARFAPICAGALALPLGWTAAHLQIYVLATAAAGILAFAAASGGASRQCAATVVSCLFVIGYSAGAGSPDALRHLLSTPAAAAVSSWLGAGMSGLLPRPRARLR